MKLRREKYLEQDDQWPKSGLETILLARVLHLCRHCYRNGGDALYVNR